MWIAGTLLVLAAGVAVIFHLDRTSRASARPQPAPFIAGLAVARSWSAAAMPWPSSPQVMARAWSPGNARGRPGRGGLLPCQ